MQNHECFVELINVHKSFGKVEVLKGVDLTINQGDFVSIRGKSGAGKTNLFKIMGLLENANEGTVNIFGKDASMLSDDEKTDLRLKQMGLVFQFFNLLPSLTVLENIELPMSLLRIKKPQRRERAHELLKFFDITELAERYPENLSGGERQRIAVIRALVNSPSMLIADEPTSSLDDENSTLLMDLLRKISREQKVTVVLTSTDLYEPLQTSRDYLLKDGKIHPLTKSCETDFSSKT